MQKRWLNKTILMAILCSMFWHCSSDKEKSNNYLKELGIELKDEVSIIKHEGSGFAEYNLELKARTTPAETKRIIDQIKQFEYYSERPPRLKNFGSIKEYYQNAYRISDSYYIVHYDPDAYKIIFFDINETDNVIAYTERKD